MISIIVCSINDEDYARFQQSVEVSIGVHYEIVKINNKIENLSIAQAYNKGALLAQFDILLFVHEDIILHSSGWGMILIDFFQQLSNPGVLGVAGSSYLPIAPSDWWMPGGKYLHTNFLSNKKSGKSGEGILDRRGTQIAKKVYALDGMFLAVKKSVFLEFLFDEELKGFHGYDTSLSYRVSQKYQNYFVPNIVIEHFSSGYPNVTWLLNTIASNREVQPYIRTLKVLGLDKELEVKSYRLFLGQLIKFGTGFWFSFKEAVAFGFFILSIFFSFRIIYYLLIFPPTFILRSILKYVK